MKIIRKTTERRNIAKGLLKPFKYTDTVYTSIGTTPFREEYALKQDY